MSTIDGRGTRISVVIASSGRPDVLAEISAHLALQTHLPHRVVFSVVSERDFHVSGGLFHGAVILTGAIGLPAQRNRGMEYVLADSDVIVFFDDDYVPCGSALAGIARFFQFNPAYVGANGHLIADGINSAGISYRDAARLVDAHDRAALPPDPVSLADVHGLYGCNMAYRASAIADARFDEKLPLYGWQEDIDFAAQLMPRGRLGLTNAFAGVHRGIKKGRASGVRLGYSQVANPLYLMRKGTMRRSYSLKLIARNVFANHWRALRQEPWVDRRGRVRGNWLAFIDVVRGQSDPERILRL